jgi:hypothetical protein
VSGKEWKGFESKYFEYSEGIQEIEITELTEEVEQFLTHRTM